MLEYRFTRSADRLDVTLTGELVEQSGGVLARLQSELPGGGLLLAFHLEKVSRIDSIGLRLWATFVAELHRSNRLEFHECSTFFIDFLNLVPNASAGGQVVSFHAPLRCGACKTSTTVLLQSEWARTTGDFGSHACPRCGAELAPEVRPEDYLTFLLHP